MIDTIVGGIRDCIFFLVVGYLGSKRIIGEPILAALLSAYTAHRFGLSMGKQQAVIALSGGATGSSSTGGGPGSSGSMRAVVIPPASSTRESRATTRRIEPIDPIDPRREPDQNAAPPARPALSTNLDTGAYQTVAATVGGIV